MTVCIDSITNESIKNLFVSAEFASPIVIDQILISDLENFKIIRETLVKDCLRFNGVKAGLKLKIAEARENFFRIEFNDFNKLYEIFYLAGNPINSYLNFYPEQARGSYKFEMEILHLEFKLGKPYKDCELPPFDHHNCLEECISKTIALEYECSIYSYYQNMSLKGCFEGLNPNKDVILKRMSHLENNACLTECPDSCVSKFTKTKPTFLNETSSVWFNFTVRDTRPLKITELPKIKESDLLGAIGGTLGVFLGMSILSFYEILNLIFEFFFIIILF